MEWWIAEVLEATRNLWYSTLVPPTFDELRKVLALFSIWED